MEDAHFFLEPVRPSRGGDNGNAWSWGEQIRAAGVGIEPLHGEQEVWIRLDGAARSYGTRTIGNSSPLASWIVRRRTRADRLASSPHNLTLQPT